MQTWQWAQRVGIRGAGEAQVPPRVCGWPQAPRQCLHLASRRINLLSELVQNEGCFWHWPVVRPRPARLGRPPSSPSTPLVLRCAHSRLILPEGTIIPCAAHSTLPVARLLREQRVTGRLPSAGVTEAPPSPQGERQPCCAMGTQQQAWPPCWPPLRRSRCWAQPPGRRRRQRRLRCAPEAQLPLMQAPWAACSTSRCLFTSTPRAASQSSCMALPSERSLPFRGRRPRPCGRGSSRLLSQQQQAPLSCLCAAAPSHSHSHPSTCTRIASLHPLQMPADAQRRAALAPHRSLGIQRLPPLWLPTRVSLPVWGR